MILHIPMISPITKYHQLIDYSPSTVNSDLFFQPLKNRIICSGVKYKFWKINYPIPLEFVSNWSMKILSRRRSLRKKILISSRLLNLLPVMNQKLGTSWRKKLQCCSNKMGYLFNILKKLKNHMKRLSIDLKIKTKKF